MSLTLRQVLEDNDLGLEVVAGKGGVDSRGPVSWIHTSELPDPSKWLRGGEILLTTGFGVRRAPKAQRALIVNLDVLGCVGIGLGVGDWLKAVPEVMIDEANRRGFPLFTVPYTTPFSVVTRHVAQRIFEHQYARQRGVDAQRHVLAQALLADDVPSIVQALARQVPSSQVFVFDYFGTLLARHSTRTVDTGSLWRATTDHRRRDYFSVRVDDRTLTGAVIRVDQRAEALLLVVSGRALREGELALFEQSAVSLGFAIRHGASPRTLRRSRFSAFLRDVADDAYVADAVADKLRGWGVDLRRDYVALAFKAEAARSPNDVASLVEDAITENGLAPLVGLLDDRVYALVGKDPAIVQQLALHLRRDRDVAIAIGVSRPYRAAADLRHTLREAGMALDHEDSGSIRVVDELGFAGLIPYLRSDHATVEAAARVLLPIVEHDRRHGSQLVRTLDAFVRNGFRPGAAAAELAIHRHTLGYRLQQIAQLTNRDLQDGGHLLELAFALRMHDSRPGRHARGTSRQSK